MLSVTANFETCNVIRILSRKDGAQHGLMESLPNKQDAVQLNDERSLPWEGEEPSSTHK